MVSFYTVENIRKPLVETSGIKWVKLNPET